jgi:hypothetical protein
MYWLVGLIVLLLRALLGLDLALALGIVLRRLALLLGLPNVTRSSFFLCCEIGFLRNEFRDGDDSNSVG